MSGKFCKNKVTEISVKVEKLKVPLKLSSRTFLLRYGGGILPVIFGRESNENLWSMQYGKVLLYIRSLLLRLLNPHGRNLFSRNSGKVLERPGNSGAEELTLDYNLPSINFRRGYRAVN